ncbi:MULTISPECIES: hemolysin family protein [Solirubrobacterales]|uniref:hemolysin family protein n=1 Tax=Solirubrobacterales TaxID=588673 RepID=UPI001304E523|nr:MULTISPECIES: hemolysin family protein [Solirubrobacterales]
MQDALGLLAVLALVGANAFFVVGEYAVVTARRGPLNLAAAEGSRRAAAALRLMDDPVRVISTVQVGITMLGILTGALGEPIVRDVLGDGVPGWLAFLIAFGSVTYLSVVLGELVPKSLTLDRAEALVMRIAVPIELLARLFRPVVWVLRQSSLLVLRPFGVHDVTAGDGVQSPEELRELVDEAEGSGVIAEDQERLLHNVLDFADRDARDVMVAARDVRWLDAEQTVRAALDQHVAQPHTRYPVGDGSIDRLVGVVHVRELLAAERRDPDTAVGDVATPAVVVPESKSLRPLLAELRAGRKQLAVVVDEYGSTAGIVTLEDLLEQLVGSIEDEYDPELPGVEEREDGALVMPGATAILDLERHFGLDLGDTSARTVAGAVFERLGRRPRPGDVVEFDGSRITVQAVDGTRITEVAVLTDVAARD